MSKKTPVKKSKRRLKRSVRRSLAAVLMITAIAVAAIPVPENMAAPDDPVTPGGPTVKADIHESDAANFKYDEDATKNNETLAEKNLGTYKDATDATIKDALQKGDLHASLNVVNLSKTGESWDLEWQFMFYNVTTGSLEAQGVLCKYNDQYMESTLDLDLNPITEYYTVDAGTFNAYYDATDADHSKVMADMDGVEYDPTQTIKFTYDGYVREPGATPIDAYQEEILEDYFGDAYNAKKKEFDDYKAALDAGRPANKPVDLEITPSRNFTEAQKEQYYCEHNKAIKTKVRNEAGYRLVSVQDSRITGTVDSSGNKSDIYVVRHESKRNDDNHDANGFLVKERGLKMYAIGEKAFANISSVGSLTLPGQINYIGDDAFYHSFIQSVTMESVRQIGNRAFKDCSELTSVTMTSATNLLGKECFSKTAITAIDFPYSISKIGYGAFADCKKLTTVNMNKISVDSVVGDFAFYNCAALNKVDMDQSGIYSIGKGAFAVASGAGSSAFGIALPSDISTSDGIGDFMFAGRSSLQYVVFPKQYGSGSTKLTLPKNMFHGCSNLEHVEFPADRNAPYACGNAAYEPEYLFADVVNPDFYVKGPEKKNLSTIAEPRQSTWRANTWVNDYVPYVFEDANGVEHYEVVIGDYRYQANEKKELTSCELVGNANEGNLVIPSKVGKYEISSIAPGCFGTEPYSDEEQELRDSIKTITIEDNSVTEIQAGVFKGLPNLTKVSIGNSVSSIGASAFEDCRKLIDVTFHTPQGNNYTGFTIGANAFKTNGTQLTFHGDIVQGYEPFRWAMDPDNKMNTAGMRVCYKSLAPDYLTVIYDANTGLVTLIDYPKFEQVDDILEETHWDEYTKAGYDSYANMMEAVNYATYSTADYDPMRNQFRTLWNETDAADRDDLYTSNYYGPWINESFCTTEQTGGSTGDGNQGGTVTGKNSIADWLFEPIVAYAAGYWGPLPYYTKYPYSAQDNSTAGRGLTEEESLLIQKTKELTIPAGVDSIDVYGYYNGRKNDDDNEALIAQNVLNATTYLTASKIGLDSSEMYFGSSKDPSETVDIVPGLFSGYYDDKLEAVSDDPEKSTEQRKRGNDRIEKVFLGSVKYLPNYAFDSCENLKVVELGPDCADIGIAPFRGCYDLRLVGNNQYYETENGIVYSVNPDGSYTIEECLSARGNGVGDPYIYSLNDPKLTKVSAIKPGAFEDCDSITRVILDDAAGLMEIPEDCFKDCQSLGVVSLPETVNSIKNGAFEGVGTFDEKANKRFGNINVTIPGKEVFIAAGAFDHNDRTIVIKSYKNTSAIEYADYYGLTPDATLGEKWMVLFLDIDGTQLSVQEVVDNGYVEAPAYPNRENWVYTGWLAKRGEESFDEKAPITADTTFVAQGYSTNTMVDGKYKVDFFDTIDFKVISTQYVERGGSAVEPRVPEHPGYAFVSWSDTYTNITGNKTIYAVFNVTGNTNPSSGTTTNPSNGTTTNPSNGTTTNPSNGTTTNPSSGTTTTSNRTTSTSSGTTSSSTSSSSTSATSTSGQAAGMYSVTVINGSGSGTYPAGSTVLIMANEPAAGKQFSKWVLNSQGVTLANVSTSLTTFVMPSTNVVVTAEFIDRAAAPTTGTVSTRPAGTTDGNSGNSNDGNTRVDITKPGINNKDLATANVNGSTDNFIVKISETPEATQAVMNALTNKYGSLDNLLYYAMDISLYDSTGTTKITDTTGLTVDITIPLPDALITYGGNNMMGAVVSDQMEDLAERFTTINGVPCISFTATHFSPYTIYVNTQNLSEGLLDTTPKTGDPIHPKWFLSLGLACLSIILFMKKDRKAVVRKTA